MNSENVSQHDFEVIENKRVTDGGIWRLRIVSPVAASMRPGQFMNVLVPNDGSHILRIPLSFSQTDAKRGEVELLYAVVGEGTQRLSRLCVGDVSTLLGPCGNGWRLPLTKGRALLVSGGIGLPPIMAAARMLASHGVGFDLVVGARTKDLLVWDEIDAAMHLVDSGGRILICTDDGSEGIHGFTTAPMGELLKERDYAQAYTCGRSEMMAAVARLAQQHDVACQVSTERMMGCGFGACSCCNVPMVAGGNALCCQDGPVFDSKEVAW